MKRTLPSGGRKRKHSVSHFPVSFHFHFYSSFAYHLCTFKKGIPPIIFFLFFSPGGGNIATEETLGFVYTCTLSREVASYTHSNPRARKHTLSTRQEVDKIIPGHERTEVVPSRAQTRIRPGRFQ